MGRFGRVAGILFLGGSLLLSTAEAAQTAKPRRFIPNFSLRCAMALVAVAGGVSFVVRQELGRRQTEAYAAEFESLRFDSFKPGWKYPGQNEVLSKIEDATLRREYLKNAALFEMWHPTLAVSEGIARSNFYHNLLAALARPENDVFRIRFEALGIPLKSFREFEDYVGTYPAISPHQYAEAMVHQNLLAWNVADLVDENHRQSPYPLGGENATVSEFTARYFSEVRRFQAWSDRDEGAGEKVSDLVTRIHGSLPIEQLEAKASLGHAVQTLSLRSSKEAIENLKAEASIADPPEQRYFELISSIPSAADFSPAEARRLARSFGTEEIAESLFFSKVVLQMKERFLREWPACQRAVGRADVTGKLLFDRRDGEFWLRGRLPEARLGARFLRYAQTRCPDRSVKSALEAYVRALEVTGP